MNLGSTGFRPCLDVTECYYVIFEKIGRVLSDAVPGIALLSIIPGYYVPASVLDSFRSLIISALIASSPLY
jgi:hypothetical protein